MHCTLVPDVTKTPDGYPVYYRNLIASTIRVHQSMVCATTSLCNGAYLTSSLPWDCIRTDPDWKQAWAAEQKAEESMGMKCTLPTLHVRTKHISGLAVPF